MLMKNRLTSDGEVRPPNRQVHGHLSALSRRRRPQGRERGHRLHQGLEVRPVCRLVSYRLQGYSQLFKKNQLNFKKYIP